MSSFLILYTEGSGLPSNTTYKMNINLIFLKIIKSSIGSGIAYFVTELTRAQYERRGYT